MKGIRVAVMSAAIVMGLSACGGSTTPAPGTLPTVTGPTIPEGTPVAPPANATPGTGYPAEPPAAPVATMPPGGYPGAATPPPAAPPPGYPAPGTTTPTPTATP